MSGSQPDGKRGRLEGPGQLSAPEKLSAPGKAGAHGKVNARGQLSAPGRLAAAGTLTGSVVVDEETGVPSGENTLIPDGMPLRDLALTNGLKPSASRPPIFQYLASLWQRRYFITGFATAQNIAMYTEARLGQVWQILTPLFNVAVYYLIFGVILDTKRGIHNFIAFLVIGVFVFNFTQRVFLTSSRVMFDSLPLIRALYFPRACLPLGYVLIELQQLAIAFLVLFGIVLASGEPLTWYWLLLIPVLIMQTLFNSGAAFILARFGAGFDDVSQLLPFVVRTWFYASGVMFSIQTFHNLAIVHPTIAKVLQYNPAAIYITLTRDALMRSQRLTTPGVKPYNSYRCNLYYYPPRGKNPNLYSSYSAYCHALVNTPDLWLFGVLWAVVVLVAGFIFFWRAEVHYGRG
jgi:teichoic acid transport system permease protein